MNMRFERKTFVFMAIFQCSCFGVEQINRCFDHHILNMLFVKDFTRFEKCQYFSYIFLFLYENLLIGCT